MKMPEVIRRKAQRGFTLIELMVVVGIVAIVAVWGVPALSELTMQRRVDSAVTQFKASIQLARSAAVTSGRSIHLCAANATGTACVNGNNWSAGWLVYAQEAAPAITVIQVYQPNGVTINTGVSPFTINPTGMSTAALVVQVAPQGGNAILGKTLSYANVSMKLTISDGA